MIQCPECGSTKLRGVADLVDGEWRVLDEYGVWCMDCGWQGVAWVCDSEKVPRVRLLNVLTNYKDQAVLPLRRALLVHRWRLMNRRYRGES